MHRVNIIPALLLRATALAVALGMSGSALGQSGPGWERVRGIGMMDLVIVDRARERDKDVYRDAFARICAPKLKRPGLCKVMFWTDRLMVPRALPMTDAQLASMRANFTWNGNTGHRSLTWSCDIDPDPSVCFR